MLAHLLSSPRSSWEVTFPAYSEEYFAFCTAFAHLVATSYMSGKLTFDFADRAMNELFSYSYTDDDRGMPDFAWQVFNAFDQGEFQHPHDSADVDPEVKYTKAILTDALAKFQGVNG